ncbi:MAG: hypothetical protein ACI4QV_00480 [Acutalibacteraceae bacterium]
METVNGYPENCDELLTKYGTYNIQPTDDTRNFFPAIAQGTPNRRKINKKIKQDKENGRKI